MAAGKLSIYTLGHTGVVLDQNPLEPSLPDDSFRSAQNANHDPTAEHAGGVRKRPGLKQFNLTSAGGVILGGIGMPVAGTGGAPSSGGGGSTGTGPFIVTTVEPVPGGTSGPGTDFANPPTGRGSGTGAGEFTPTLLFNGARLIIIGRANNDGTYPLGIGWYVSSKGLADAATTVTTPTPAYTDYLTDASPFAGGPGAPGLAMDSDGWVYYQQHTTNSSTSALSPIRKTNGADDRAVVSIPLNSEIVALDSPNHDSTHQRHFVTGLAIGAVGVEGPAGVFTPHDTLLITVRDTRGNTSTNYGRMFTYDTVTNTLAQVATVTPITAFTGTPVSPIWFGRRLWFGTHTNTADGGATIYAENSQMTNADVSLALPSDITSVTCMAILSAPPGIPVINAGYLGGLLCAGTGENTAGTAGYAKLYLQVLDNPTDPTNNHGTWGALFGFPSGSVGTAVNGNFISSMVEFNGDLYVAYYNPTNISQIYRMVAGSNAANNPWNAITSFSAVWESSGSSGRNAHYLFVDDGVLYAIGTSTTNPLTGTIHALKTTDGVTWTDVTTHITHGSDQSFPLPVLFGVEQS